MKNTNLHIEEGDYTLDLKGLEINYRLFCEDRTIMANPAEQAADLLKKSGYINDYTGSGDDVAVEYERDYSYVDEAGEYKKDIRLVQEHWEDFVASFDFKEEDALSIAAYREAEKQAEKDRQVFDDIAVAITMCGTTGLTANEIMCWSELRRVQSNTMYGIAIKEHRNTSDVTIIKQFLKEFREAAEESGGTIRHTIGDHAYDLLMKLPA